MNEPLTADMYEKKHISYIFNAWEETMGIHFGYDFSSSIHCILQSGHIVTPFRVGSRYSTHTSMGFSVRSREGGHVLPNFIPGLDRDNPQSGDEINSGLRWRTQCIHTLRQDFPQLEEIAQKTTKSV